MMMFRAKGLIKITRFHMGRSFSSRSNKRVSEEIDQLVDMYSERIPLGVIRADFVSDIAQLVPPVHHLQMKFRELKTGEEEENKKLEKKLQLVPPVHHLQMKFRELKTGEEEENKKLEKKLESLMSSGVRLLRVVASREPVSVVRLFLHHGLVDFKNPGAHIRCIKKVHCLALKTGMLEDGWMLSRLMSLYAQSSAQQMEPEELVERLFHHHHASRRGDCRSYNLLLKLRGQHDLLKAEKLYAEMLKIFPPNPHTFRILMEVHSQHCLPEKVAKIFSQMQQIGVTAERVHYAMVIDALARIGTPPYLRKAVILITRTPLAQEPASFNIILSRCVPKISPTSALSSPEERDQILADTKEKKNIAEQLVNEMHKRGFVYSVNEKTYSRLRKVGLKWPTTVTTTKE
ncbi:unnamed protein product [Microthlaspi erraticum]|uniref:Pentacotripeptide-repeat region of PRORP domain-containing protein n=1 Tax=Microthlaspi erraticum TaxID=1685480 RepID=A0A6D2I450_9BRAS|nr:unnamed protein product [Microthlaspi erraticum]